jgi:hypothetical protein
MSERARDYYNFKIKVMAMIIISIVTKQHV